MQNADVVGEDATWMPMPAFLALVPEMEHAAELLAGEAAPNQGR